MARAGPNKVEAIMPRADSARSERPVRSKKCTDCGFIPLFVVFWAGMLLVAIVGFATGDARRLVFATDYLGQTCGTCVNDGESCGASIFYPRVGFDAILQGYNPDDAASLVTSALNLYGICVSSCPDPGSYVCTYDVEKSLADAVASDAERQSVLQSCAAEMNAASRGALNNYGLDALEEPCLQFMQGCWYVAQPQTNVFFRCVGTEALNETSSYSCYEPAFQDEKRARRMPARVCPDEADLEILPTTECDPEACRARSGKSCIKNDRCIYELERSVTYSIVDPRAGAVDIVAAQLGTWTQTISRNIGDIRETWWTILLIGVLGACLFGVLWLHILKHFVGIFVWLMIFLSFVGLTGIVLVCFAKAGKLSEAVDTISDATDANFVLASILSANETQTRLWNAMGIILAILECVYFLFIVAMWHRLKLAVKILIEASRATESIATILFVPFFTSLCIFVLGIYAVGVFGYIVTAGATEIENLTIDGIAEGVLNQTSTFQAAATSGNASSVSADEHHRALLLHAEHNPIVAAQVTRDLASVNLTSALNVALQTVVGVPGLPGMVLYHIFGCLWTFYVISGVGTLTISTSVSRWYWRGGADYTPDTASDHGGEDARISAMRSYTSVLRYHFGTICFGALLIATMQFIRLVIWYIVRQGKKLEERNVIVQYILCALGSCLWCTKWLLKYVTTNAYIMVGMHGCSFCSGAERAVGVLMQNLGRVAAVSLVNTLVSSLSILVIVSACAILEYLWLERDAAFAEGGDHAINSVVLSVVLTALAAFWVANGFMQVYEVAVETILLCFCQDVKLNRGSKAYVMSSGVRKVMARRRDPPKAGSRSLKRKSASVAAHKEAAGAKEVGRLPMVATT